MLFAFFVKKPTEVKIMEITLLRRPFLRYNSRSDKSMIEKLKEILRHRQLIMILVSRELKARYRGTVLGFFWSLFNPLLLMLVYTVVFGFIVGGGRVAGFRQHQVLRPVPVQRHPALDLVCRLPDGIVERADGARGR